MPEARSNGHLAWFFLEDGLTLAAPEGNRVVQRGLLLLGGTGGAGDVLGDTWVFDLTGAGTGLCPWIPLGESTAAEVASGVLSWDAANDRRVLAGGYRLDGVTTYTSDDRLALDLDDLASPSWSSLPALPSGRYTTALLGDTNGTVMSPSGDCASPALVPCFNTDEWAGVVLAASLAAVTLCEPDLTGIRAEVWAELWDHDMYIDPCAETYVCERTTSDGTVIETEIENLWYEDGCAADPQCTEGVTATEGDSVSVSGLAELGGAVDPASGLGLWAEGTTGCDGPDCAGWDDLAAMDGESDLVRRIANSSRVHAYDGGWSTAEEASGGPPAGWPDGASWGRRALGSAGAGATWDVAGRAWSSTNFRLVLVGGTLHQSLGPGLQNELSGPSGLNMCDEMCLGWEDNLVAAEGAMVDELDARVVGDKTLSSWDGAGWTAHYDLGGRLHPAAAGTGGARVIVVGGEPPGGGDGGDDVFVVDLDLNDAVAFAETTDMGTRVGAAAAYDPVTRTTWVFGGHSGDDTMWQLSTEDSLTSGEGVAWTVSDPDRPGTAPSLRLRVESPDGVDLSTTTTFRAELACAAPCFVDDLDLLVAARNPDELDSLTVNVDVGGDTAWTGLEPWSREDDAEQGFTRARVRLPRYLSDGDELLVEVAWTRAEVRVGNEGLCHEEYDSTLDQGSLCGYRFGEAPSPLEARTAHRIPVVPTPARDVAWSVTTEANLPTNLVLVAPGACDVGTGTCGPYDNLTWGGYQASVYEGLSRRVDVAGSGTHGVTVWMDDGLTTASAYAWGSAPDGSVEADVGWLEERLGALRNGTHHLLFVRSEPGSGPPQGTTLGGVSVVRAATSGNLTLGTRRSELASVHELAHAWVPGWWGTRTRWGEDAAWLKEGLPELLAWTRRPDLSWSFRRRDGTLLTLPARDSLHPVAQDLADATCGGIQHDLERHGQYSAIPYRYGPYTLAQAYHLWLATGGTSEGWWSSIRDLLDAHPDGVDAAAVSGWLGAGLGLGTFYEQWVLIGRVGTPLLALSDARTPASEGPGDTGDTGETGDTGTGGGAGGLVEVRQVQHLTQTITSGCVDDAPLFSTVPWWLGCADADAPSQTPFASCEASRDLLWSPMPRVLTTASEVVPLVREAGYDRWSDDPAWFAVLANDALLPEDVPLAGAESSSAYGRAWRWFLACGDDDLPGDCGDDVDADGWPASADCDDDDPAVNPGVVPNARGADDNCDGWR